MKQRCLNPDDEYFHNYGGRGIRICQRWLGKNGLHNFVADMGRCPPGLTLDRKNNNGNYTPKNCRWATRKQQQRNTRITVRVTIDGVAKAFNDWVEHFGVVSRSTAYSRYRRGWSAIEALTTPRTTSWHRQRHEGKVG